MRNRNKRLSKIHDSVQAMPATPQAVEAALASFQETGKLPDHKELAQRTAEEALRASQLVSIRQALLSEAVGSRPGARNVARLALRLAIRAGFDVTNRNFVDEGMEVPEFGSIGLHLLGWPEILIQPPYEAQAKRAIEKHKTLCASFGRNDFRFRKLAEACSRFSRLGELPEHESLRDAVVAFAEFLALHPILGGEEDAELLAAFDQVAAATDDEKAIALQHLQSLMAQRSR